MDRTNHPTAPGGRFDDPDPGTGAPGTTIDAAHMNAVQDELIALIEGAGLAPDRANLAQLLEAVQRLAGTTGGLRNWIINGTFRIWQRADDFRGATGIRDEPLYTADRWEVQSDDPGGAGDGNVTRIRDQQAPGVAPGVFDALRYEVVTAPNTGAVTIRTKLETLRELAGRRLTLSFLARGSSQLNVTSRVRRLGFGEVTTESEETHTIATAWTAVTVSFDMVQVADQQEDVDAGLVYVEFELGPLAAGTFDLARVQLEVGAVPSAFEDRPRALELLLCQRYFAKSWDPDVDVGTNTEDGRLAVLFDPDFQPTRSVRFPVSMRVPPTVGIYPPEGGAPGRVRIDGILYDVASLAGVSRQSLGRVFVTSYAGPTPRNLDFHYTADAEI
ncbi:MAG: hypothetical protein AAFU73_24105 [Planctomycetota bacterium]